MSEIGRRLHRRPRKLFTQPKLEIEKPMARPRKPTAVLALSGQIERRPGRYSARKNEPKVDETIGAPPEGLCAAEALIWDDLAGYGVWLTAADRLMLEIACRLFRQFRAGDTANTSKLITALSKLGFNPTDRSKVNAPGGKPDDNQFAEFK